MPRAENLDSGLVGQTVRLRAIRSEDSELLFAWVNDPEVARFSAPYRPVHGPSHEQWLRSVSGDTTREAFAIESLANSALVGVVQLIDIHPVHRSAEMRIRIGEVDARGRGYGSDALRLLLDHAWQDLGLQRVHATVFENNARARKAYGHVGFEEEGRLRRAAFIYGTWCDVIVVAALNPWTAPA